MSIQFEDPGTRGGAIDYGELNGSLLIVEVLEDVGTINTVNGPKNAVRANVTVVDGDHAGARYPDTLVFPVVLYSQLQGKVAKTVLGRLGQGEGKPGQSPPWTLEAAGDDDKAKAEAFLAKTTVDAMSEPF